MTPSSASPVPDFEEIPSRLFPGMGFPVLAGAGDLLHDIRPDFDRELVEFSLVQPFPAEAVIRLYEEAFGQGNLIPDPEQGYPMRRWESWNGHVWTPTTMLTDAPMRYVASWVDRRRTVRTVLILRYERNEDGHRRQKLQVHLNRQKLFRLWDLLPWR